MSRKDDMTLTPVPSKDFENCILALCAPGSARTCWTVPSPAASSAAEGVSVTWIEWGKKAREDERLNIFYPKSRRTASLESPMSLRPLTLSIHAEPLATQTNDWVDGTRSSGHDFLFTRRGLRFWSQHEQLQPWTSHGRGGTPTQEYRFRDKRTVSEHGSRRSQFQ